MILFVIWPNNYITVINFYTTKHSLKRVEKATDWSKVFSTNITEKGFVSRINNSFKLIFEKKVNNAVGKWAKDMSKQTHRGNTNTQQPLPTEVSVVSNLPISHPSKEAQCLRSRNSPPAPHPRETLKYENILCSTV